MQDSGIQDITSRLADEVVRLFRLGQRARSLLHTGDLGAEFSALMLLFPLRELGPLRVTELAELKQADPSTISRQVAQLVKGGLVRRQTDPTDRRAARVAVTDAGLAACEKLHQGRQALLSQALSQWPVERVTAFVDLFTEFNSSIETLVRNEPAATPPSLEIT